MIITTVSGDAFFISLKKSIPSILGRRKSVITASKFVDWSNLTPSTAFERELTEYPSLVSLSSSDTRISFSSSTMSILFFILKPSFYHRGCRVTTPLVPLNKGGFWGLLHDLCVLCGE